LVRLGGDDAPELFVAVARSQALHLPWVTPPDDVDELRRMLSRPPDVRIAYGVRTAAAELAAVINLTAMIRGPFQSCFVSYYALVPHESRGYVRAGLCRVLDLAFTQHGLHRVEANVQPGNTRSARLVLGLGFRFEGRSPRYLNIGGEWRDHDHYALTAEEWGGEGVPLPEGGVP
jgi:ribosomal-protein-alanine N-acetyltransferase